MAPQLLDEVLEFGARRIAFRGEEQRIAHVGRVAVGILVQERERPVGDLQCADADVVGQLIAEILLQIGAMAALRFGEDLDPNRGVVEPGDDAEAVLADRQRRLSGVGLRGAGYLFGAAHR